VCQLTVPLRQEVFTPHLPKGTYYRLIFTGKCEVKFAHDWECFDALYKATSSRHNYTNQHHALNLDGQKLASWLIEQDRFEHQYTFSYRATGNRLSVLLEWPFRKPLWKASHIANTVQLTVVALSRAEVLQLGLDQEERERIAVEQKEQKELEQQAFTLAIDTHGQQNFLDPDYRQLYARKFQDKILHGLNAEWQQQYRQVLGNARLYTLIQEQHPHVIPVLEAKLETLRLCERLPLEDEHKEQRSKQALELAVKAHVESNFLDPKYQQRYASRFRVRILHTESREWLEEYHKVLDDPQLRALIEELHPHVLPFLEARLDVVRLAEWLVVTPQPQPPAPEPPPPEKTPEEKRAEDLSSFKDTTAHYRQKALLRLAIEQEFLDELHKQFPNLSPQELRQELQKFRDEELSGSNGRRPSRPIKTY
jgi:hypothetical protein